MAVQSGIALQQTTVWTMTPFVVQVLLKHFQKESTKKNEDILKKCKICLHLFESLSKSFSHFFVFYFTLLQVYSVFTTFLFIDILPLIITLSLQGLFFLIGYTLLLLCNFIWLVTLTNSIDECSDCIQGLKREIQDELLSNDRKQERKYLKYLIQRIEDLKPMNACGYFTVGKSTLTSMLSVRWWFFLKMIFLFINLHYLYNFYTFSQLLHFSAWRTSSFWCNFRLPQIFNQNML